MWAPDKAQITSWDYKNRRGTGGSMGALPHDREGERDRTRAGGEGEEAIESAGQTAIDRMEPRLVYDSGEKERAEVPSPCLCW